MRCWPRSVRPGNAGANNAADNLEVFELALEQLPPVALEMCDARSDAVPAAVWRSQSREASRAKRRLRVPGRRGSPNSSGTPGSMGTEGVHGPQRERRRTLALKAESRRFARLADRSRQADGASASRSRAPRARINSACAGAAPSAGSRCRRSSSPTRRGNPNRRSQRGVGDTAGTGATRADVVRSPFSAEHRIVVFARVTETDTGSATARRSAARVGGSARRRHPVLLTIRLLAGVRRF